MGGRDFGATLRGPMSIMVVRASGGWESCGMTWSRQWLLSHKFFSLSLSTQPPSPPPFFFSFCVCVRVLNWPGRRDLQMVLVP